MSQLTTSQVEFYQQNGFLSPLTAIAPEKALEYRRNLEVFEASQGVLRT